MAPSRAAPNLSIPSTQPLPNSLRIASNHPALFKSLSKLSRPALLELAAEWCSLQTRSTCGPYINEDYEPDDLTLPYTAATTYDELTELYRDELSSRRGSKRELLDRILEGDWRHGISLQQLAMAETRSLLDHPTSQRWSAFILSRHQSSPKASSHPKTQLPRIHPPTLILSLHKEISSLTKAHYYFTRPTSHPITLLRISLFETPYADSTSTLTPELTAQSKSIFIAFPDGTPFVYISATQAAKGVDSDSRSIQSFVLNAIPVALSKPQERYELKSTSLTTRSLDALLSMRGAGKGNVAGGGWSVFAEDNCNTRALDFSNPASKNENLEENKENVSTGKDASRLAPKNTNKRTFEHSDPTSILAPSKQKRLKRVANGRFGISGHDGDGKDISRFDVRIEDQFSPNTASLPLDDHDDHANGGPWKPSVKVSFQGSHVFAGIRRLVEIGVINAAKMPGWLTGEGNVSVGIVRNGRIDPWDRTKE